MDMTPESIWEDIGKIRSQAPLVHNITNYVVMNTTANALLAIGASPVMAHAVEEVDEMVALASALVLNIGTLSSQWIEAMLKAGMAANKKGIPVVLDPVGAGATSLRTETAHKILKDIEPGIIRGNASEIFALARAEGVTRGVDSTMSTDSVLEAARELAADRKCAVSVSGATDIVITRDQIIRIRNGHPMMARVTGLGCTASALAGAFSAVNSDSFNAATHAAAVMGIAGEIAAEKAAGPGTLQLNLLDILSTLTFEQISGHLSVATDEI
jgi:hydroxyethylthiazole kinase